MREAIEDAIRARWRDFHAGPAPERLSLLMTSGSVEGRTATMIAMDRGRPLFVVKVYREGGEREVARESSLVARIRAAVPSLYHSIPAPLYAGPLGGFWAYAQSVVPGVQIPAALASDDLPSDPESGIAFMRVLGWLEETNRATRSTDPAEIAGVRNRILQVRRRMEQEFSLGTGAATILDLLEEGSGLLDHVVTVHGDFTRHNILDAGGRLSVIDWSFGAPSGLPMSDSFFFAVTFFLQIRRRKGVAGIDDAFENSFLKPNRYSEMVGASLVRMMLRLDIDRSKLRPLFACFLADQACAEYDRVVAALGRGQLPRFAAATALEGGRSLAEGLRNLMWMRFVRAFAARPYLPLGA